MSKCYKEDIEHLLHDHFYHVLNPTGLGNRDLIRKTLLCHSILVTKA